MDIETWMIEFPDMLLFTDPDFSDAVIGHTEEGRLVYQYDKMVDCLAKEYIKECIEDGKSITMGEAEEMAIDWISYNTIRALPYMDEEKRPIIIYAFEAREEEC